jgi:hypothetical protein
MQKRILLEMLGTYRKMIKTFVNIFYTQIYINLSCQRENLYTDFSSGLNIKKTLRKNTNECGLSKQKLRRNNSQVIKIKISFNANNKSLVTNNPNMNCVSKYETANCHIK